MLNRRDFLKVTSLAATCGTAGIGRAFAKNASTASEAGQPNIVFLLTDDQRARTFSATGHPVIKTPNIDRLASDGVRFTNAFVTDPTCMPSRTTYFTGVYERVHGIGFSSQNSLSEKQWALSYPELLRRGGYYTGFIGKIGLERYDFRGRAKDKFDFWRAHDGWARFWAKTAPNCRIYEDSESDIVTPIMGESIERFLESRPTEKPFCLSVSFSAPHGSISGSMLPEEGGESRMTHAANSHPDLAEHPVYGDLYRDKEVRIPEECATDPSRFIPAEVLKQPARAKCYSYNYTKETCLEHHYRYYQLITGIDRVVGELRRNLEERGLADNTIIIYTSDHGLLMGEYGMGGKALCYDLTTRIPFLVYDPRLPESKRGKEDDAFVISADVAPTILHYAGIDTPEIMQGRSLTDLLENPGISWRDEVFLENLYVGRDNPLIEAVRNKDWKYIRYFENPGDPYDEEDVDFQGKEPIFEQLFDLRKDPSEKVNLVEETDHGEVLAALRKRCRSHSSEQVQLRKEYVRLVE